MAVKQRQNKQIALRKRIIRLEVILAAKVLFFLINQKTLF
jgi:hypothetical protein